MPSALLSPGMLWRLALSPRFLTSPSVVVLIAANLLPLFGVLFWGWSLYSLMVLYWLETGIIGFFAIVRMAFSAGWIAIVLVPFFIVHFGGFMIAHVVFLTVLFSPGWTHEHQIEQIPSILWGAIASPGLWAAFLGLWVSHGVSFILNVVRPAWRERRQRLAQPVPATASFDPIAAMKAPYGRVVIMHVTILLGAFLASYFGSKTVILVLLIAIKIVVDIAAHVRQNILAISEG